MDGRGAIELIVGAMFSGKTREMLARVEMATFTRADVLVVRFAGDTRYGDDIATHSGAPVRDAPAGAGRGALRVVTARQLAEVEPRPSETVIGVDEGQFYPDLARYAAEWAGRGRRVVVAALDGDADMRPFASVSALIPHCDQVEKRRGACARCGAQSVYSTRLSGASASPDEVSVGGAESYAAVCRACRS